MRRLVLLLLLGACQAGTPTALPGPEATRADTGPLPPGFVVGDRSAVAPTIEGDEIIFTVNQGDCSPWSDQRGASDCATRTTRSVISTGKDLSLGQQYLFGFDFWIDPGLTHPGYRNPKARLTNGFTSRLSIARWEGDRYPNNQLFDVKVDTTRGVTFLGRTCIPPSEFGKWHRLDTRVRWANDETGFLEVRCDSRPVYTGRPIYAASNVSTNQAPHCFAENHCDPGVFKDPGRFNLQLGIIFDQEVVNGRAVFPRIPTAGLTVRMRRPIARRLYVVFGRVEAL